jgi:hypothetical protein
MDKAQRDADDAKRQADSDRIDMDEFDRRTHNKWRGEHIETFRCKGCHRVFVGLPDAHVALSDPKESTKTAPFSMPKRRTCPFCMTMWHDGKTTWLTERITADMLRQSEWSWLMKQ